MYICVCVCVSVVCGCINACKWMECNATSVTKQRTIELQVVPGKSLVVTHWTKVRGVFRVSSKQLFYLWDDEWWGARIEQNKPTANNQQTPENKQTIGQEDTDNWGEREREREKYYWDNRQCNCRQVCVAKLCLLDDELESPVSVSMSDLPSLTCLVIWMAHIEERKRERAKPKLRSVRKNNAVTRQKIEPTDPSTATITVLSMESK